MLKLKSLGKLINAIKVYIFRKRWNGPNIDLEIFSFFLFFESKKLESKAALNSKSEL